MISFELGVEDLADTRFALCPLHETLMSLRVLREPGLVALHLPWRRMVVNRLGALDRDLLGALVARRRTVPDFLTPLPTTFAPDLQDQLARVRAVPPARIRHDLILAHAPDPVPAALAAVHAGDDAPVLALRDAVGDLLQQYWQLAIEPWWPQIRLVLEADMTYRARQLAMGGARLLFADMHPNLRWQEGVLQIEQMISAHRVVAAGRGLLLLPSVFAHKPAPPLSPDEAPSLLYPSRGVATLWHRTVPRDQEALIALVGTPKARLLDLLDTPLPTVELARQTRTTPSAVSQHLQVLYATGLVFRARSGRQVLYRRTALAEQLLTGVPQERP